MQYLSHIRHHSSRIGSSYLKDMNGEVRRQGRGAGAGIDQIGSERQME